MGKAKASKQFKNSGQRTLRDFNDSIDQEDVKLFIDYTSCPPHFHSLEFENKDSAYSVITKRIRKYEKKLKQIASTEQKQKDGLELNTEQNKLIESKSYTNNLLKELQEIRRMSSNEQEEIIKEIRTIILQISQLICSGFYVYKYSDFISTSKSFEDNKFSETGSSTSDFMKNLANTFESICGYKFISENFSNPECKFMPNDINRMFSDSACNFENFLYPQKDIKSTLITKESLNKFFANHNLLFSSFMKNIIRDSHDKSNNIFEKQAQTPHKISYEHSINAHPECNCIDRTDSEYLKNNDNSDIEKTQQAKVNNPIKVPGLVYINQFKSQCEATFNTIAPIKFGNVDVIEDFSDIKDSVSFSQPSMNIKYIDKKLILNFESKHPQSTALKSKTNFFDSLDQKPPETADKSLSSFDTMTTTLDNEINGDECLSCKDKTTESGLNHDSTTDPNYLQNTNKPLYFPGTTLYSIKKPLNMNIGPSSLENFKEIAYSINFMVPSITEPHTQLDTGPSTESSSNTVDIYNVHQTFLSEARSNLSFVKPTNLETNPSDPTELIPNAIENTMTQNPEKQYSNSNALQQTEEIGTNVEEHEMQNSNENINYTTFDANQKEYNFDCQETCNNSSQAKVNSPEHASNETEGHLEIKASPKTDDEFLNSDIAALSPANSPKHLLPTLPSEQVQHYISSNNPSTDLTDKYKDDMLNVPKPSNNPKTETEKTPSTNEASTQENNNFAMGDNTNVVTESIDNRDHTNQAKLSADIQSFTNTMLYSNTNYNSNYTYYPNSNYVSSINVNQNHPYNTNMNNNNYMALHGIQYDSHNHKTSSPSPVSIHNHHLLGPHHSSTLYNQAYSLPENYFITQAVPMQSISSNSMHEHPTGPNALHYYPASSSTAMISAPYDNPSYPANMNINQNLNNSPRPTGFPLPPTNHPLTAAQNPRRMVNHSNMKIETRPYFLLPNNNASENYDTTYYGSQSVNTAPFNNSHGFVLTQNYAGVTSSTDEPLYSNSAKVNGSNTQSFERNYRKSNNNSQDHHSEMKKPHQRDQTNNKTKPNFSKQKRINNTQNRPHYTNYDTNNNNQSNINTSQLGAKAIPQTEWAFRAS